MGLTNTEALNAADYNKRKCAPVGWGAQFGRICSFMQLQPKTVTNTNFAHAICNFQGIAKPKLKEDGKLGPNTWGRLKSAMDTSGTPAKPEPLPVWLGGGGGQLVDPFEPVIPAGPAKGGVSPWMDYAMDEKKRWDDKLSSLGFGANQKGGEREVSWDEEYFRASPSWGTGMHELGAIAKNNADWCAAFVNYCLHRGGYSHTGSAGAHSFLWRWAWHFEVLREPRRGCVIVVGDAEGFGGKGKGAHVAFLDSWHNLPRNPNGHVKNVFGRNAVLLGGNQRDRVTSRRENTRPQTDGAGNPHPKARKRDFLAVRRNNVCSPYLWPLQGPPTCTISSIIPTEQPHHCHFSPPLPGGAVS